ncbi:hypothetical protein HK097_003455, partial [Rhizophlyctis rosea]
MEHQQIFHFCPTKASAGVPPIQVTLDVHIGFGGSEFTIADQATFLWPGAEPLCQYLLDDHHSFPQSYITNRNVLELGAGTGLTSGLSLQLKPKRLLVTDFAKEALSLLEHNLSQNLHGKKLEDEATYIFPLDWNDVVQIGREASDVDSKREQLAHLFAQSPQADNPWWKVDTITGS